MSVMPNSACSEIHRFQVAQELYDELVEQEELGLFLTKQQFDVTRPIWFEPGLIFNNPITGTPIIVITQITGFEQPKL